MGGGGVTMVVGRGGGDLRQEETEFAADAYDISARTPPPAGVRGGDGLLPAAHLVELHISFISRRLRRLEEEEEEEDQREEDQR
jgi:hypothetical protein